MFSHTNPKNRNTGFGIATVVLTLAMTLTGANSGQAQHLIEGDVDTAGGGMTRISTTFGNLVSEQQGRWVVAGRDDDQNLRLKGQRYDGVNSFVNDWTATAGNVTRVAVDWMGEYGDGSDIFVTAVRNGDHKLQVIVWRYGDAFRLDDYVLTTIDNTRIDIGFLHHGASGQDWFVTAVRKGGKIRLDLWRISYQNGGGASVAHSESLTLSDGTEANVVVNSSSIVSLVYRNSNGRLQVWKVSVDLTVWNKLSLHSGWQSSPASNIHARSWSTVATEAIMTAFEDANGQLRLYAFDVSGNVRWAGGSDSSQAGSVSSVVLNKKGGKLATLIKYATSDTLKLIVWKPLYDSGNWSFDRLTDNVISGYSLGEGTSPSVEGGLYPASDVFMTSRHDGSKLRMTQNALN